MAAPIYRRAIEQARLDGELIRDSRSPTSALAGRCLPQPACPVGRSGIVSRRAGSQSKIPDSSPRLAVRRKPRRAKDAAFTLLELQVALVILGLGLLAMPPLMAMQSRQIARVEAWCRSGPTFYVVSQPNRWLRRLGAPAEMATEAGTVPWTPPVTGEQDYQVQLGSLRENLDARTLSATVSIRSVD